jgi:hypothetical protein
MKTKYQNMFFPICDQFEPNKNHTNGSLYTQQSVYGTSNFINSMGVVGKLHTEQ